MTSCIDPSCPLCKVTNREPIKHVWPTSAAGSRPVDQIVSEIFKLRGVMKKDKTIWQSFVWHKDKAYFVSTIERDFETFQGIIRGQETLTWEWNPETRERGKLIHQAGHICEHHAVCRCLILFGEIPDKDDERYERFNR